MKAISPLIATVLLIAFVVAVGGLITVWLGSLTTSQTETVGAGSEAFTKCVGSSLLIEQVKYSSSGSSQIVNVTLSSTGSENIKNITISISGGGGTTNSIVYFNGSNENLIGGGVFSTSINTASGTVLPPSLVSASGLCQGTYAVGGRCEAGDSCMKPS